MKKPLVVGDRCRAVGYPMMGSWVDEVGTLTWISTDGTHGTLTLANGARYTLGLRSFSRLVKRERREFWVIESVKGCDPCIYCGEEEALETANEWDKAFPAEAPHKVIHVREVRKKGGSK